MAANQPIENPGKVVWAKSLTGMWKHGYPDLLRRARLEVEVVNIYSVRTFGNTARC